MTKPVVPSAQLGPGLTPRVRWCSLFATVFACTIPALAESGAPNAASAATNSEPAEASPEAKKKAMGHFETGLKLYEDGEFSLALIEFERAYSYIPDFRVLYNIGQVSIQLGRYARAAQALKQYLDQGSASIALTRVQSVQADLAMLEGRTAHLRVECNVPGAEVLLDDVRIATTPFEAPLLVDAGEHRLTVQHPGYLPRNERLVLAGRDDHGLRIELVPVTPSASQVKPVPAVVAVPPLVQTPGESPMLTRTKLLYIGAGSTGLLAAGWAVTGYLGISAAGELNDELKHPSTESRLSSLRGKAQALLLTSDILGACALGAGATTLYFALTSSKSEPIRSKGANRLELGFAPSAVLLHGTFH